MPSMSQNIFDLNLPVETVSLYLLCCGLADAGRKISVHSIKTVWNGSDEALKNSLNTLEKRNIIQKIKPDDAANNVYCLVSDEQWAILDPNF